MKSIAFGRKSWHHQRRFYTKNASERCFSMALQGIRNNVNSWVVKALLALLVVSFAAWGIGDFVTGGRDSTAIKINGERVSVYQLQRAYQQKRNEVQQQLQGVPLTPEILQMLRLKETVVNEALRDTLLRSFAVDMGLTVPDAIVAEAIRIQPQFLGDNGEFDRERYVALLRNAGYSTDSFEALVREDLMRQHLRHPFLDLTFNTEAAIQRFSDQLNETRDVRALLVSPRDVPAPGTPNHEQLQALYDEVKTQYPTHEYRAFDVVMLDLADFIREVTIDDEQVQTYYAEHKADFNLPERRSVEQLVFSTRDEAEKALADLQSGGDFDGYAAKQSAPRKLGTVAKGDLPVPAVDTAVFNTAKGAFSPVVETPFGFSVLRVTDITPARTRELAEVKDQIAGLLKRETADALFEDTLTRVQDMVAGASALRDLAGSKRITVQSFDKINLESQTQEGKRVFLPGGDVLLNAVFSAEEGTIASDIRIGDDKVAFIEVTGIIPARLQTMDELRSELTALFTQRETDRLMMEKAQLLLVERGRGARFEDLARTHKLAEPMQTLSALKRNDADRNTLMTSDSRAAVFGTGLVGGQGIVDRPYKTVGGLVALFEITGAAVADTSTEQLAAFTNMVNQAMAQDLYTQMVAHLQQTAKMDIRHRMIDSAFSDTNN
jgi:peptidyl-prolyl cis-trans isomerase D